MAEHQTTDDAAEVVRLRKKIALLESFTPRRWTFEEAARTLADLLDPAGMTASEQTACISLIRYCKKHSVQQP